MQRPVLTFLESSLGTYLFGSSSVHKLNKLIDFAGECWKVSKEEARDIIGTWMSDILEFDLPSENKGTVWDMNNVAIKCIKKRLEAPLPELRRMVYDFFNNDSDNIPEWSSKWESRFPRRQRR